MDRAFFDMIKFDEKSCSINNGWDMEVVDRSFDKNKIKEYLSLLNEPDCCFISELIDKTTYIKYDIFKNYLVESFNDFKLAIGEQKFYLMLPKGKIGSEHWLTALLWPELNKLNLVSIIDIFTVIVDIDIIDVVIIDDALYSGINITAEVDDFTYELSLKLNISQKELGKKFRFHFIIPFVTSGGVKTLFGLCKYINADYRLYNKYEMKTITDLIEVNKYYPENASDELYKRFGVEIFDLPPIYFDHKVAGPFSTYSTIYLEGIIPNNKFYGSLFKINPSREKIEQLKKYYVNYLDN